MAILDFRGKWKSVNISKIVRDRAISSEFLSHRVVQVSCGKGENFNFRHFRRQECPVQRGKISIFATFGGHLGFFLPENEKESISKAVRDRAISSKFLTRTVVQECPVERGKISIFATFGGHLGFSQKMEKCQYLENCKR